MQWLVANYARFQRLGHTRRPPRGRQSEYAPKVWMCIICGWMYDEEKGAPRGRHTAPGTRWEDVPEDWCCPDCGAGKGRFRNGGGLTRP